MNICGRSAEEITKFKQKNGVRWNFLAFWKLLIPLGYTVDIPLPPTSVFGLLNNDVQSFYRKPGTGARSSD